MPYAACGEVQGQVACIVDSLFRVSLFTMYWYSFHYYCGTNVHAAQNNHFHYAMVYQSVPLHPVYKSSE